MLEKVIEAKLRAPIRRLGGLCLKFEAPGYTGVPDRIILLPGGRVVFVETKAPGKTERPRQDYVQDQFRALGFKVFGTVDSAAKTSDVIRYCEEVIRNGS